LMGWDDGRTANRPGPALALGDGDRAELSTDGQAPTGHVAYLPHALGREQREDPRRSATAGACSTTGVALRPAAIDPAGPEHPRRSGSPRTTAQPADAATGPPHACPRRLGASASSQCRGEQRESGRGSIDHESPQYLSPGSGQQSVQLSVLKGQQRPVAITAPTAAAPLSGSQPCGCGIGLGDNQERMEGG
jgi:hypothetical protein